MRFCTKHVRDINVDNVSIDLNIKKHIQHVYKTYIYPIKSNDINKASICRELKLVELPLTKTMLKFLSFLGELFKIVYKQHFPRLAEKPLTLLPVVPHKAVAEVSKIGNL